jgi:hypothetical protein
VICLWVVDRVGWFVGSGDVKSVALWIEGRADESEHWE